ncbi:MAG: signal recognition particle receptor subunit alpha, partial [Halobacteriaceae archaeon]
MFESLKDTVKGAIDSVSDTVEEYTTVDVTDDFDDTFWPLEQALLQNNVAVAAIDTIKDDMREELAGKRVSPSDARETVREALKSALRDLLMEGRPIPELVDTTPYTIVFTGVNGSGKTTTLAKVAYLLQQHGHSIVLAAADTYRAASIEQIEEHG